MSEHGAKRTADDAGATPARSKQRPDLRWIVLSWVLIVLGSAAVPSAVSAEGQRIEGRVVGITDGDTITVLDADKRQHKIRLAAIDAPERGQPGGQRSKESLSALVYDQPVRVESNKRDRFDRVVGRVWVAEPVSPCRGKPDCPMTLDAGLAQITIGRAWWFQKYAGEQSPEDRGRYEFAEQEARAKKAGLWRDGTAVPPWEWRAARSNVAK